MLGYLLWCMWYEVTYLFSVMWHAAVLKLSSSLLLPIERCISLCASVKSQNLEIVVSRIGRMAKSDLLAVLTIGPYRRSWGVTGVFFLTRLMEGRGDAKGTVFSERDDGLRAKLISINI